MSAAQWVMLCVGYVGCLGLSFFLSGMETGLTELSRLRLRRKAREGNANAGRLQDIVDQPEDMLWTILVGNTRRFMGASWAVRTVESNSVATHGQLDSRLVFCPVSSHRKDSVFRTVSSVVSTRSKPILKA